MARNKNPRQKAVRPHKPVKPPQPDHPTPKKPPKTRSANPPRRPLPPLPPPQPQPSTARQDSIIPYAALTEHLGPANEHLSLHATTIISASKINTKVRSALSALGLESAADPTSAPDGAHQNNPKTSASTPAVVVTLTARADAANKAISVAEIVKRHAAATFARAPDGAPEEGGTGSGTTQQGPAAGSAKKGKRRRRTPLLYQYTMLHAVPARAPRAPPATKATSPPASAVPAPTNTAAPNPQHPDTAAQTQPSAKRKRDGPDDDDPGADETDAASPAKAARIAAPPALERAQDPTHEQDATTAADPASESDNDSAAADFQTAAPAPPRPRLTHAQPPQPQPQADTAAPEASTSTSASTQPQRPTPALTIILSRTAIAGLRAACAEQAVLV